MSSYGSSGHFRWLCRRMMESGIASHADCGGLMICRFLRKCHEINLQDSTREGAYILMFLSLKCKFISRQFLSIKWEKLQKYDKLYDDAGGEMWYDDTACIGGRRLDRKEGQTIR